MTKSHHPSQINQYTNQRTKGIEGGSEWETTTYQKEGLSTAARGGLVEDAEQRQMILHLALQLDGRHASIGGSIVAQSLTGGGVYR